MTMPNHFGVTAAVVAAKLGEAPFTAASRPVLSHVESVLLRKARFLRDAWTNRGGASDSLTVDSLGYAASADWLLAAVAVEISNTLNRGEAAIGFAQEGKRAMSLIEGTPSSATALRTDATTSVLYPSIGGGLADRIIRGGL